MSLVPIQVYDPRVQEWRLVILATDEQGRINAHLPVDGWKTEQEAYTAGLALMVVLQKKAQAK